MNNIKHNEGAVKNKLKILIIVAVALLLIVAIAISWVETYWHYVDKLIFTESRLNTGLFLPDRVTISVDWETAKKIQDGELTVEDFSHNNIEKIEASTYWSGSEIIHFDVFLKDVGVRKCKQLALHLRTLPFILTASIP